MHSNDPVKELFLKRNELSNDALSKAVKGLSRDDQWRFYEMQKQSYFVPENEIADSARELPSPTGKYRLVVSQYTTKPGAWSYSQGIVYSTVSPVPIAVIRRNYGAFPHLFTENHPNGHDYLICGEDYQGQTVIELDTGKRRDFLPEAAESGRGFCWAEYRFDAASRTVIVAGCIWACGYEFRLYDFSDPTSGWPEILNERVVDDDRRWPLIEADGTVVFYQSQGDGDGVKSTDEPPIAATLTFRREGLRLVFVNEWVSEKEQLYRAKCAEAERRREEKLAHFRATDPLYLTYLELLKDPALSPASWESIGMTYDKWCPHFTGSEQRMCRRIVFTADAKPQLTIDLSWAMETGPIKLNVFLGGKQTHERFFEHSVEGMREAFDIARLIVSSR